MPDTTDRQVVTIGDKSVIVVPQKHARLRRRLSGEDLSRLLSGDYGHQTYRVLGVLVPDLHRKVPEWEWEGFKDKNDWERWREDAEDPRDPEQADHEEEQYGPTTDEIVRLFEAAFRVSGAQRLGKLVDIFMTTQRLSTQAPPTPNEQQTPSLPVSLGEAGESA